jgi:hypothetical protein
MIYTGFVQRSSEHTYVNLPYSQNFLHTVEKTLLADCFANVSLHVQVHMSGTSALEDGRSDHLHLRWGKLRRLRPDDMSSVSIAASRTTPDAPLEVASIVIPCLQLVCAYSYTRFARRCSITSSCIALVAVMQC